MRKIKRGLVLLSEKEFLEMIPEFFKGGGLLSVFAAAILLKKYVVNGSVNRFFDYKRQEIEALNELRMGLLSVIAQQEKLNEELSKRQCLK